MLILDSGGVSMLAERSTQAAALITVFKREGLWPPLVPSVVLVECLSGRPDRDVRTNRFLKTCDIQTVLGRSLPAERLTSAVWPGEGLRSMPL